jgi:hypothetical protein
MVLEAGPDAPLVAHVGAGLLLYAHIVGGTIGMIAGPTAVAAPKGGRLHRGAGHVFFAAMLGMAGVGATVAPFLPDGPLTNTTAGAFTTYLVVTGWLAVRRPPNRIGRTERVAVLAPIAIAVLGLFLAGLGVAGRQANADPTVYVFAAIAAVAAACDLRMIRRGGIVGPARLARHLWRLMLALAIALGSFFLGQSDEIPAVLRGPHLALFPLGALAALIYWMARIRTPRGRRAAPAH